MNSNRDVILDLVREIREDVKEVRKDLKPLADRTLEHERDITWIKGGLSVALACVLGIAAWLANLTATYILK